MKCFGQKIRNYHCKVVLLDEQELIQEIQSSSVGQELLETIFKHLNLIETSYFGLRFIDNTGQTHWLDPGKKIIKQLEGTEPFTFYFGVKFYAADPCKLVEEITRYQFFLQIKQDIHQGRLPVPNDLTAELCAYAVQSEVGDYDPRRHCSGYISEFRFIANQSLDLESSIAELHKTMAGQVPAVAELNYLEKVKWLDMYGVDLHPVLGEDNVDYFLGLTPSGVIVLRNKTKVGNYFWPRISKINHKGKYFMLRVRSKSNEEQTYGFETPSKSACKHLYRCSVEHNAFFRLVQVAPSANSNKTYSLNSRFRDSSRSDSSVRRRAQPQFVRTPSRRYQRRVIEGAQDDDEGKEIPVTNSATVVNKTLAVPQPVETTNGYRATSNSAQQRSDSPRSTKSAPWPAPDSSGKKYSLSVPSPKSVRSAGVGSSNRERDRDRHRHHSRKRSVSAESNSSCESKTHRRHRHHGRSRRGSDAESEVSRASGKSHGKRRHHKSASSSRRDSGSESENCSHRHKHRHRHRQSGKYELVDSEMQWKEVQQKQALLAVQQASVVRDLGLVNPAKPITATPSRKSGYINSGQETETEVSYHHKRKHRRSHRSKSPDKRLTEEVKRHLEFQLVDTDGMSEEQRRQIPYMKVETTQEKVHKSNKIRYHSSIKSNKSSSNDPHSKPAANKLSSGQDANLEILSYGDSPPPPYSPPTKSLATASENGGKPAIPQKPVINSLSHGVASPMTASHKPNPNSSQQPSRPSSVNQFGLPAVQNFKSLSQPQPQVYGRSSSSGRAQPQHELGLPDTHHPSPSESPDSQKIDSHHENSDSGLGTDHQEYYKSENFSSLSYTLPRTTAPTAVNVKSFNEADNQSAKKEPDWSSAQRYPHGTAYQTKPNYTPTAQESVGRSQQQGRGNNSLSNTTSIQFQYSTKTSARDGNQLQKPEGIPGRTPHEISTEL